VDIGDSPGVVSDLLSWYEEDRRPVKILVVIIHAVGPESPDIHRVLQWLSDALWDISRIAVFDASGAWLESTREAFHQKGVQTTVKREGLDAVQEAMGGLMDVDGISPAKH
jgi:hypothetical protein